MPCNDPETYIDRTVNKALGRGYIDSKTKKQMERNIHIYEWLADDRAVAIPRKEVNIRTDQLCRTIGMLSKSMRSKLPKDVRIWWEDHKKHDGLK